jgi:hypothetical protein
MRLSAKAVATAEVWFSGIYGITFETYLHRMIRVKNILHREELKPPKFEIDFEFNLLM